MAVAHPHAAEVVEVSRVVLHLGVPVRVDQLADWQAEQLAADMADHAAEPWDPDEAGDQADREWARWDR